MTPEERAKLTAEGLPTWVSDSQWRSHPSIPLWKEEEERMRYLAQSVPLTPEEARQQAKLNHQWAAVKASRKPDRQGKYAVALCASPAGLLTNKIAG